MTGFNFQLVIKNMEGELVYHTELPQFSKVFDTNVIKIDSEDYTIKDQHVNIDTVNSVLSWNMRVRKGVPQVSDLVRNYPSKTGRLRTSVNEEV